MAEISAVSAARAAVLRNDTRNLRQQEQRNAERLQLERQAELDKKTRIIQDQLSLARRESNTLRADQRQENANRLFFDAQVQSQDTLNNDREVQNLQDNIQNEILSARRLDVERSLPPLTPSEPVGVVITPEELEIQRQLAEPDRPPPVGFPPLEERVAPPTPFESPDVAAIDNFEPAQAPDQTKELSFANQERERVVRVDVRRTDEFNSLGRQEVDLQLAQDRIDAALFDPERPRGTLVDVFG